MSTKVFRTPLEDRGAYAILYALLVVVIVGVASIVVDLATLRESRRLARSAADSAALAAASQINVLDPSATNPRAACDTAWRYLADSLEGLSYADRNCVTFPTTYSGVCVTTQPPPFVGTSGRYEVRVTWPVQDGSPLLTNPDVRPGDVTQAVNPAVDGDDPCARISVEVITDNDLAFAGVFGVDRVPTRSASVARGVAEGDGKPVIAALNVLEPTRCYALNVTGQGSLIVRGQGTAAGVLAVESDGREGTAGDCPSSSPQVIGVKDNPLNFVRIDGPAGPGKGVIEAYARNAAPVGNPDDAYEPADVVANRLQPKPGVLVNPTGAAPVTDVYDCTSARGCTQPAAPWITQLRAAYGGSAYGGPSVPGAYSGAAPGYASLPFKTLPGPDVPEFKCSMPANYPAPTDNVVEVPAGNWFVNCASLDVSNQLIFQGGNVVTAGDITLKSDSCFAMNVPTATTCPAINASADPKTSTPAPATDAILFLRSGKLDKGAQASLFLPQTFAHLSTADGFMTLGGGGTGNLLWTTPLGADCGGGDDLCRAKRFTKLCLWSESTLVHDLGGQAGLEVRGVFFIPNAKFDYAGQGNQDMDDAQFWVKTMEIGGQGTLSMSADPEAAVERYSAGVALIR